jgi:hypothetical protein
MGVFEDLKETIPDNKKNFDRAEEVPVKTFIESVLPTATAIELLFEGGFSGNLMSLIAPVDPDAKSMFKWPNNFSWAYKGDIADSMKARVKSAGGNVDGVLRFSIQWNENNDNQNDFDAHCLEPRGNLISYPKAGSVQNSSGMLDVDIITPRDKIAVENIVYTDLNKMPEGDYAFGVHNFDHCGGTSGFTAEIEFDGKIHKFAYPRNIPGNMGVDVAVVNYTKEGGFKMKSLIPSELSVRNEWGINTEQFHPVSMVLNSPNHWDEKSVGNKHYFFILEGCNQPGKARGFFNEFLLESLNEHRRVFEVLGAKMKTPESDRQLSGLGFSSTQRNHVICKVTGSTTRIIKILF